MGRTPLDIPWEEVMPDQDRLVPMVDVLPAGGADADAGGRDGGGAHQAIARESCAAGVLTDHQLAEKVERLQRHIASGFLSKLPDKGAKLTANLSALEEEQERRRSLPRAGKGKDDEECREIKQLESRCSPDSLKNISSNATTAHSSSESFGFHFSRFMTQTDGAGQGTYSEELSLMRKDRFKNLNEVYGRSDHRRMSSRASPFLGPKSVINKDEDKQKSLNGHNKGIALSSGSSHQLGETRANRFPKRRKTTENHGSSKSTKVQDVVLLDEDVQPVEQIREGDEPDERLQPAKEAKIYYPSSDHPECVELCQSDIKCLKPESYLSSTIMNFYIQYLQNSISSSGRPSGEYHFCNTYFYSKLEEAISHKGETGKHLTKLRRWWKGINIFEKAYIFLPIHKDVHWSLVIICIPAKEDESGPIILHLDSLKFHASTLIFDNIERYLKEEWMYLKDTALPPDLPFSERIWRKLPYRIAKKTITVPQQKNEYDCGLFVLYFMERFIEAAPARLRRKDLAMFGSKWFHPEEASALRKRLRKLILEEFVRLENHGAESPASHVSSLED